MGYETKQSKLVYEFLKSHSEKHFSAEDVYFELINSGEKIGRTTVYRQLDKLLESGIVNKYSTDDNSHCYQFADCSNEHKHYHLKCSVCGKLFHTECDFLDKLSSHILKDHQFTVDPSKIVIYGICQHCAKEN